jgi:ketosteroid isomerase-like protein
MTDAAADTPDGVMSAEQARRAALINADAAALDRLHADDLMWVHSSGRVDDKAALLDALGSGGLVFIGLGSGGEQVRLYGTTALLTYDAEVSLKTPRGVFERRNKVCVVWTRQDEAWRAVHWQSTAIPSD